MSLVAGKIPKLCSARICVDFKKELKEPITCVWLQEKFRNFVLSEFVEILRKS
jgi:hypothetical protein